MREQLESLREKLMELQPAIEEMRAAAELRRRAVAEVRRQRRARQRGVALGATDELLSDAIQTPTPVQ